MASVEGVPDINVGVVLEPRFTVGTLPQISPPRDEGTLAICWDFAFSARNQVSTQGFRIRDPGSRIPELTIVFKWETQNPCVMQLHHHVHCADCFLGMLLCYSVQMCATPPRQIS